MALQVVYSVGQTDDCLQVTLTDSTGSYDAVNNPTGYGVPNAAYGDVDHTTFVWILPSGATQTLDKSFVPSSPSGLDVIFETTDFTSLSGTTKFPDGLYTVTYNVYDSGNTLLSSKEDKFVLFCQATDCVKGLVLLNGQLQIGKATTGCGCDGELMDKAAEFVALLEGAMEASGQDAFECAAEIVQEVQRRCSNICQDCD